MKLSSSRPDQAISTGAESAVEVLVEATGAVLVGALVEVAGGVLVEVTGGGRLGEGVARRSTSVVRVARCSSCAARVVRRPLAERPARAGGTAVLLSVGAGSTTAGELTLEGSTISVVLVEPVNLDRPVAGREVFEGLAAGAVVAGAPAGGAGVTGAAVVGALVAATAVAGTVALGEPGLARLTPELRSAPRLALL